MTFTFTNLFSFLWLFYWKGLLILLKVSHADFRVKNLEVDEIFHKNLCRCDWGEILWNKGVLKQNV